MGGKIAKPEIFKTGVLGLKDKKNKNKLSFQEDFDI